MFKNKDTLEYQLGCRPGTMFRDMSEAPLTEVVKTLSDVMSGGPLSEKAKPEQEAVWFYLQNHAVALISLKRGKNDPLGGLLELVEDYQSTLSIGTIRLFYYLLLICTRESRHMYDSESLLETLKEKYGQEFVKFYQKIKGGGSDGAVSRLKSETPEMPVGPYVRGLEEMFFKGKYSGGYGGPKWGVVTTCLRKFVTGEYTAEMMMDTGFTLCHNGGPIFNKGMLYTAYSAGVLGKLLDAQRAGKIPQYVETENDQNSITKEMKDWQKKAKEVLGFEFGGVIDWSEVEKLGAVGKYTDKGSKIKTKPAVFKHKTPQEAKDGEYMILAPNLKVKKKTRLGKVKETA